MDAHLDAPAPSFSAEVAIPGRTGDAQYDLSEFRYERLGSLTADDHEFRRELYMRIGAIVVAGGHAEAAMKRVVLTVEGRATQFAEVDFTWSDLVKRLKTIAASDHELAAEVAEAVTWGEQQRVKKKRDDAVHSYWWHWHGVGVSRSRFTRDGQSMTVLGGIETLGLLDEHAVVIFEYARRLDALVLGTWPQARLIPPEAV